VKIEPKQHVEWGVPLSLAGVPDLRR